MRSNASPATTPRACVHGEGVAIGLALAFRFSARLGLCRGQDAGRVANHLALAGLPTTLQAVPGGCGDADALLDAMAQDKKVKDGALTFILARGIGGASSHRASRRTRCARSCWTNSGHPEHGTSALTAAEPRPPIVGGRLLARGSARSMDASQGVGASRDHASPALRARARLRGHLPNDAGLLRLARLAATALVPTTLAIAYLACGTGPDPRHNWLGDLMGSDLAQVWVVGRTALGGRAAEAYDLPVHLQNLAAWFGPDCRFAWHYPPIFLLPAASWPS